MKKYVGTVTPGQMNWYVTVDGKSLPLRLDLAEHSPDGFAWGYSGSGPSQLALALLADASGNDEWALAHYQRFKGAFVAGLDKDLPWERTDEEILRLAGALDVLGADRRSGHMSWGPGDVDFTN